MNLGRLDHIGVATPLTPSFVTPAKTGVQHRQVKFERQELDSRLRGNDEVWGVEVVE